MASSVKTYRKLTRSGSGSYYLVIPPQLIRELKWKERQKLTVRRSGKSIVIADWDLKATSSRQSSAPKAKE